MNKPETASSQTEGMDSITAIVLTNAYEEEMYTMLKEEEALATSRKTYEHLLKHIGESVLTNNQHNSRDRSRAIELKEAIRQGEMRIESIQTGIHTRVIGLLPEDVKDALCRMPARVLHAQLSTLAARAKANVSIARQMSELVGNTELYEEEIDMPDERIDTSSMMNGIPRNLPPEIDPANPYNQL